MFVRAAQLLAHFDDYFCFEGAVVSGGSGEGTARQLCGQSLVPVL
jgi:hypothetical protein